MSKLNDKTLKHDAFYCLRKMNEEVIEGHMNQWQHSEPVQLNSDFGVEQVIECPQLAGETLYAVFEESSYLDDNDEIAMGLGMYYLFDKKGKQLSFGYNSNHKFVDLNGDRIIDEISISRYGYNGPIPSISILNINPVIGKYKYDLRVIFDWDHIYPKNRIVRKVPDRSNDWHYEIEDIDGDGISEVFLGKVTELDDGSYPEKISRDIMYKWEPSTKKWVGPKGGMDQHFMVINNSIGIMGDYEIAERFAMGKELKKFKLKEAVNSTDN